MRTDKQRNTSFGAIAWSFYFFFSFLSLQAQDEIPLGTWRLHISYNNVNNVTLGDGIVFGASQNGIVAINRSDNSITTLTKMNGLHGAGITYIKFDKTTHQLLIAYDDGKIDRLENNVVSLLDPSGNSNVTGSRKINHISIRENLAYISADYGVIIFDLFKGAIKETWRDIGINGQQVKVLQSTFKDDSIFLATDKGIFAGNLKMNLLDFNFWKRFDTNEFSGEVQALDAFNGRIYAAVANVGLFRYESGAWSKEVFLQNESHYSLTSSVGNLFISSSTLWKLSDQNMLEQISAEKIGRPHMAIQDEMGKIWIADALYGIVSNVSGEFAAYLPNGPSNEKPSSLAFNDKVLYALGGGYSPTYSPLKNTGWIDQFAHGTWSTQNSFLHDLTDIAFSNEEIFVSSFGDGIELRNDQAGLQIFDASNSPLININPPDKLVAVTSLERADRGLWVANYGASQPLHFLTNENIWQSFSFPNVAARYPTELQVDADNNVWTILSPLQGGGILVFNKEKNATSYLTSINGAGGLPSNSVYSLAVDRDKIMWVGTNEGVAYFADPAEVFTNGNNAIRPIFEGRFLLRDDKVTSIAVDGGNRKWMGTERGVWLFSPSGEKLISYFTADNSPLLSNNILDIKINPETGEVFFATDRGLVSFRADATQSDSQFQSIKIFPNPVTPDFSGTVGISGLATDAIVKITNIAGKLVWESKAHGGMASWNVKDYSGKRAATGVYLVFSATDDGAEGIVGKIAVVE